MLELLVVLSIVEAALALAVVAAYLALVMRSLRRSSRLFAKVAFGVRAIETQTARIGPAFTNMNRNLEEIASLLPDLADRAERVAEPGGR